MPPVRLMSRFALHVLEWKDCVRCRLSGMRRNVCLARGEVPCDVVFIGESPGVTEDSRGQPFIGQSGKLLNYIISRAVPAEVSWCLTNLIGCIPLGEEEESGRKMPKPPEEAVEACTPRLQELISICDPKLIVCVGSEAYSWLQPGYKHSIKFHRNIPIVDIRHPSYLLRTSVAFRSLEIHKCMVSLTVAVEDYVLGGKPSPFSGGEEGEPYDLDDLPF